MSTLANDELLAKAAFVTNMLSAGGLSLAEQDKFIDMVIDASVIAKDARVIKMNTPKRLVEKIGFGSRIMQAATEGMDPTSTSAPTTGKVELSTVECIAAVDITYSTLEDNIDGAALKSKVMGLIAERGAVDLEELYVTGDENSSDAYLALFDGWLLQATSHTLNTSTATKATVVMSTMLRELPAKYKRNKANLRFYVTNDFVDSYLNEMIDRGTPLGDLTLMKGGDPTYKGIPVIGVDLMPSRAMILTNPQNLLVGIQRAVSIEAESKPRKRIVEVTLTCRVDAKCETEDALVATTTALVALTG